MHPVWLVSLGILFLLRLTFGNAQADDIWALCPGVEHVNCDAAYEARQDACGPDDTPQEETCNCNQDFINAYVNCQAEFTLCTGDNVITPSEWDDLFAFWERKCEATISAQSITIPTPTRTVAPSEKSKAPLASCDLDGIPASMEFCSQAEFSVSACFSITPDATQSLGAFPCLCDVNILQLMENCAPEENAAKCGYTAIEVPWAEQLNSSCRSLGLNPDVPATLTANTATPQETGTPSITFAALGPTSTGTNGAAGKMFASTWVPLLESLGLLIAYLLIL
ncbi:hypothetical protein MMYC01_210054 [Madurella mycetomatis]|uniref:Extracellular membrane protein CFEM domain-containing protein n=1 Tax=Madurella mycetomatis TaxID=100816 RepID=A0A175VQZ1_9PEZI|nr:hypothetical protein MMYC01_210054 [Madurella mycetomatis]